MEAYGVVEETECEDSEHSGVGNLVGAREERNVGVSHRLGCKCQPEHSGEYYGADRDRRYRVKQMDESGT